MGESSYNLNRMAGSDLDWVFTSLCCLSNRRQFVDNSHFKRLGTYRIEGIMIQRRICDRLDVWLKIPIARSRRLFTKIQVNEMEGVSIDGSRDDQVSRCKGSSA